MNRLRKMRIAALALLCLIAAPMGAHAQSGPGPIDVPGVYVNAASGMAFPLAVGEFKRSGLYRFDRDERDVSAGYNLLTETSGIVATVYVYPSPPLPAGSRTDEARAKACQGELDRRKQEVYSYHPGAVLIAEKDVTLPQGGKVHPGKLAIFEFEASFRGERQALHSELYVFCYVAESWAFEYRFTTPKTFDYAGPIADFMRALPWTLRAGG